MQMTWLGTIEAMAQWVVQRSGYLCVSSLSFCSPPVAFSLALAFSFLVMGILDPLRRRVGAVQGEAAGAGRRGPKAAQGVLTQLGGALETKNDVKRGHIAENLLHAGYRSPNALRLFFAFRLIGMVAIPVLVLGWSLTTGRRQLVQRAVVLGCRCRHCLCAARPLAVEKGAPPQGAASSSPAGRPRPDGRLHGGRPRTECEHSESCGRD